MKYVFHNKILKCIQLTRYNYGGLCVVIHYIVIIVLEQLTNIKS